MNAKHTPGPWTADRMFLGNSKDRRSGFTVNGPDAEPLPVRICDIRCSPEAGFAVSEANARLIAAAPDLLGALNSMLRAFEYGKATSFAEWEMSADFARAAIAKAKGGQ